jgi:hypothetical protein
LAYQKFTGEEFIDTELTPKLNDNFDAVRSGNAGTVFPTENLVIGMKFFNTSSNKEYTLVNLNPIKWQEVAYADEVGLLNKANTYTALNTYRADIAVSNGTAAGSGGNVSFGVSPTGETVQARIGADKFGGLFYHVSTNQPHVFRNGSNLNALVIRANDTNMNLSSGGVMFATVNYVGGVRWLGNANTASKLATARTITANLASSTAGSFDGSANITVGVTGTLPIANGGTGATTAAAARTALGCAPAYTYSTTDLTAGSSALTTGTLYIVYE